MTKQSQLAWVRHQLLKYKRVSRNQALRRCITRLAARANDMKREGMKITGQIVKTRSGKDYLYKLEV